MTKLYLIRHGETMWNMEKRTQGIRNIQLSELGKLQAKYLAKGLEKENIDVIYSSDLSRAYETAKIVGKYIDKPVQPLPEIREMNFGEWEGLTINEIKGKYQDIYSQWSTTPHIAKIPGAETLIQVQERAMKGVNNIIKENPGKNIVMVSHGTAIKTIIFRLLDIDLSYYRKIRQDNTAINIIDFKEEYNVLVRLNDTCHLRKLHE